MYRIASYDITGELGRGAMGVVYKATDGLIGRPAAVKTFLLQAGMTPDQIVQVRQRLLREAQAAGRLTHPGIVGIYQFGEDSGVTFIAMEYVDGPTLEQMLCTKRLDIPSAIIFLRQIAAALDYAHSRGVIHRDIKPANIMIAPDGTTKVTDFGIAKAIESGTLTQTGASLGTPFYMSPEQVQAHKLDGRSDQFSLAVVAYRMLTGEKPFQAETITALMYKILNDQPRPPHQVNPDLPAGVASVLDRALAKSSTDRYPNCSSFIAALESAVQSVTQRYPPAPQTTKKEKQPNVPILWVIGGTAAAAALAVGAWMILAPRGSDSQSGKAPVLNRVSPPFTSAPVPSHVVLTPQPRSGGSRGALPAQPTIETARAPAKAPLAPPPPPAPVVVDAPWPVSHPNNGFSPIVGPQQQPRVLWSAELGGQLRGSPVIASDGTIFIGSTDNNLYAVRDGAILWTLAADAPLSDTLQISGRSVCFSTVTGTPYRISDSGELQKNSESCPPKPPASSTALLNSYEPDGKIATALTLKPDGDVIFGCSDRQLYCIRAGQLRWKFPTGGPIYSSPVFDSSGLVYFGSNDGYLYAVDGEGQERWKINLGNEVRSSPAFDHAGNLYIASINRRLYCLR